MSVVLTAGQKRMLQAAAAGLNSLKTADMHGISCETVRSQLALARAELGAKNTTHAVALALRQGVIE